MFHAEALDLVTPESLAAQADLLYQSKRSHVKLLYANWSALMESDASEAAQTAALLVLDAAKADTALARQKCLELGAAVKAARPGEMVMLHQWFWW